MTTNIVKDHDLLLMLASGAIPRVGKVAAHLGVKGRKAFERHKHDEVVGLAEGNGKESPREGLRNLATFCVKLAGVPPEVRHEIVERLGVPDVPPRLLKLLGEDCYREAEFDEATLNFDRPWDKLPFPSRDNLPQKKGLNTQRLSGVTPTDVEWLWPQRIPLGKLTLIQGDPGLGKTWLVLDIVARVTTGRNYPDARNPFPLPRDVLWVSAEDDDGDTIVPRLRQLKAKEDRVHSLSFVVAKGKQQMLNLKEHVRELDNWLSAHKNVALIVLDPYTAYLGKTDSHRNSEVRALLGPLADLAEKHGVALVGINHLAKGDGSNSLYRGIGSIGFVAAARATWQVTADPEQPDRRLFLEAKNNLRTRDVGGLAFRLGADVPEVFAWDEGTVALTADVALRLPSSDTRAPAKAEAKEWLEQLLADGPVPAAEVWEAAEACGHSRRTVQTAKKELDVQASKAGGRGVGWEWSLKKHTP